jgi:hypothetical protein
MLKRIGFMMFSIAIGAPSAFAADLSTDWNAATPAEPSFLDSWFARVDAAQASQPHWMTPLVTVTPRLEEEVRYDQYWEHLGNGATIDNFGAGKGLELIPTTTNEVIFGVPPYIERYNVKPVQGFNDWPVVLVKQRLISANEDNGNYIVTAFLQATAPTGVSALTNNAWIITPTIAAGKGWGDFDVQGTFGIQVPTGNSNIIGTAFATNVAAQYHFAEYFWPEIELNDTFWQGGERDGKNQLFVTPGIVLGRFSLGGRAKLSVGVGYQVAVGPLVKTPVLTPTYSNAWIASARLSF